MKKNRKQKNVISMLSGFGRNLGFYPTFYEKTIYHNNEVNLKSEQSARSGMVNG
jgi:hypothetical protein